MKQLLQCLGKWLLVALNERAFLVQIDSERTIELLPSEASANDKTENPIQAVAIVEDSGIIWCAVTTLNKSLAFYRVDPKSKTDGSSTQTPTTIHKTVKRVGCLCFGRVPSAPTADENEGISSNEGLLVCVTGGLTGDAFAFSLDEPGKKRLLLGHTASMLTGVKVQGSVLLTSDRDEKIRVSAFPDTSVIKGFLLSHEAYISAMDVANSDGLPICVSCSGGDGTVRIFNYETTQLLDKWQAEKQDENDSRVPSRVAIQPDGTAVGVIYDESNVLDILVFDGEALKHQQRIVCPSQPLSITFADGYIVVLQKCPTYLQAYRKKGIVDGKPSLTWEAIDLAACITLRKVATEATISMPDSVLEKDKHGQATMAKLNETRGGATRPDQMPWNKSDRRDIAKERNKRQKRRRQQRKGE